MSKTEETATVTKDDEEKEEATTPTTQQSTTTNKGILGLNLNDPWTAAGAAIGVFTVGTVVSYFAVPYLRNLINNIQQAQSPPSSPPTTTTVPNLTPEQLSKKYYMEKMAQQQAEEAAFYENVKKDMVVKKPNKKQPSNYYDSYMLGTGEDDIKIVDDNDVLVKSQIKQNTVEERPIYQMNDLPPPQPKKQEKPIFQPSTQSIEKIDTNELDMYTDDKIDISKLPPEFTSVGSTDALDKQISKSKNQVEEDPYDITNLEMSEEELNQLMKNSAPSNSKQDYY